MKLINVDTLKEWIENWFVKAVFYLPYNDSNDISIPELYDILERMPTVEAIPVEWIKNWCIKNYPTYPRIITEELLKKTETWRMIEDWEKEK